jgi:CO/xanthine dehydrogenase FAD-binding subunit
MSMDYHRPQSLDEALSLLKEGVALGGGTSLSPRRRELTSVVDLQDIHLDTVKVTEARLVAGACVSLQSIADLGDTVPAALVRASRLEAGWNLRNMATVAGTLMASDGRSPLVTTLLALGASVELQPGGESLDLDEFLARRETESVDGLITTVSIPLPSWLAYEQVARSPADRPIVCAAAAEIPGEGTPARTRIALGGYGPRAVLVSEFDEGPDVESLISENEELASRAYAEAGDQWASAEYRSEVAGILVRRVLREGVTP